MQLNKLAQTNTLKILLFGDPGTGKTTLAASAHLVESMRPVLYGCAEGGLITLQKDSQHRYDDLEVEVLTDVDQNPKRVLQRVEQLFERAQDEKYKTVVIDTLSEVQRYGLHYLSEQQSGWGAVMAPKKITLSTYGSSMVQTSVLVRSFRDLPLNVIMTTHVKRAMLDVDGHDYVVPSLTGQQWKDAVAVFDEVLFLYVKVATSLKDEAKGVSYRAITKPFENIKAKDRYLQLPISIDLTDKTLEDLLTSVNFSREK